METCEIIAKGGEQVFVCSPPSNDTWWVTPLVIVISAVIAGTLSWISIKSARELATKRATLDLIERSESNTYYHEIYNAFTEVRKDKNGFEQLKSPTNPQLQRQRKKVIDYLNNYELMAIGISQGILDESVYKGFMRSTVVRDWFEAKGFILHLRSPTPDSGSEVAAKAAFEEFEKLALKWKPEVQLDLPLPKAETSQKK